MSEVEILKIWKIEGVWYALVWGAEPPTKKNRHFVWSAFCLSTFCITTQPIYSWADWLYPFSEQIIGKVSLLVVPPASLYSIVTLVSIQRVKYRMERFTFFFRDIILAFFFFILLFIVNIDTVCWKCWVRQCCNYPECGWLLIQLGKIYDIIQECSNHTKKKHSIGEKWFHVTVNRTSTYQSNAVRG